MLNILLTLFFGVLVTVHVSMNARLGTIVQSPALANAVFWTVGCVTALGVAAARGGLRGLGALREAPPALLISGALGAALGLFNTWIIPRIGIGPFSLLIIVGQLGASMLLSRYGLLGLPLEPFSLSRLLGLVLAGLGAALYLFGR